MYVYSVVLTSVLNCAINSSSRDDDDDGDDSNNYNNKYIIIKIVWAWPNVRDKMGAKVV